MYLPFSEVEEEFLPHGPLAVGQDLHLPEGEAKCEDSEQEGQSQARETTVSAVLGKRKACLSALGEPNVMIRDRQLFRVQPLRLYCENERTI